jgi:hypothetical protein
MVKVREMQELYKHMLSQYELEFKNVRYFMLFLIHMFELQSSIFAVCYCSQCALTSRGSLHEHQLPCHKQVAVQLYTFSPHLQWKKQRSDEILARLVGGGLQGIFPPP